MGPGLLMKHLFMKGYIWNILDESLNIPVPQGKPVRYVMGDDYIEIRANGKSLEIRHSSRNLGTKLTIQPVITNAIRVFIDE